MPDYRPHICFVAPNAYPILAGVATVPVIGGAELQQAIVARGLARRGYRVSMICLDYGQQDQVAINGITVHRAHRPDEGLPVLRFVWPRLTSLWRCLTQTNADVYYQRAAGMLTGVVAAFCGQKGKKSIFAAAGDPMIRFLRDVILYRYGVRHVDRVLVQNAAQARHFRDVFGRESTLVPNCYEVPARRSAEKNGGEILWVSTIRRLKRPDVFLDLARALPSQRFRMIGGPGDGEEGLFKLIGASAAQLRNVEFMGFVPYTKVEEYFDAAAVVVNTSETEGFPNTFLQAWARGIPTVSFVDCGARVDGRPAGRVVQTVEEMFGTVARWAGSPAEAALEGEACREYFEQNHSVPRVLDLYERVINDVFRA